MKRRDWKKDRNASTREGVGCLVKIIFDHGATWFLKHLHDDGPPTVYDRDLREIMASCRHIMSSVRREMRERGMSIHEDEEILARCIQCKNPLENDSDYANGMCGKCDGDPPPPEEIEA